MKKTLTHFLRDVEGWMQIKANLIFVAEIFWSYQKKISNPSHEFYNVTDARIKDTSKC